MVTTIAAMFQAYAVKAIPGRRLREQAEQSHTDVRKDKGTTYMLGLKN